MVGREHASASTGEWHSGLSLVSVRWELIRDPHGTFEPQALLSTNDALTPEQMVEWFVMRWQMEVTFEEARIWGSKHSANGRIWRSRVRHQCCWGCFRSSHGLRMLCSRVRHCRYVKWRGIQRSCQPFATHWRSCASIAGQSRFLGCRLMTPTASKF